MKTLDLARAAANAEILRFKRQMRRQAMRVVFGVIAAVFMVGVVILLHVLGYQALTMVLTPLESSAVVLGVDLVLAIIFGILAARGAPDTVEAEAKLLRDQSLKGMRDSLAFAALLGPVGKLATRAVGGKRAAGLTLAALAATFLANNRK